MSESDDDLAAFFEDEYWDQCVCLTPRQTAHCLNVSEEQLWAWHNAGVGPQYELDPEGNVWYFTQMVFNYRPGHPLGHERGSHLRLVSGNATAPAAAGIAA